MLHGDPRTVARLLAELRRGVGRALRVLPIRPGFIGVFAPDVDKGDALRFVAGSLGVPMQRTVACGDGTADETLLAAAAVRIAVGDEPHVLGGLPDVIVADWARLPDTLRARVLPLLQLVAAVPGALGRADASYAPRAAGQRPAALAVMPCHPECDAPRQSTFGSLAIDAAIVSSGWS